MVDAWGSSYRDLEPAEAADIRALAERIPTVMVTARDWAKTISAEQLGLLAADVPRIERRAGGAISRLHKYTSGPV